LSRHENRQFPSYTSELDVERERGSGRRPSSVDETIDAFSAHGRPTEVVIRMRSGTALVAALLTIGDVVVVLQSVQTLALNGSLEAAPLGGLHVIAAGVRALWLMWGDGLS
jgi:hypothetical protein